MKTNISVEIREFSVPNFVAPRDGTTPPISLCMVDEKVLEELCRQYVLAVYKKANKTPPHAICLAALKAMEDRDENS